MLYAANQFTSQVYAINATTGAVVWNAPGTGSDNAAPAVANGVVYVPTQAGTIAAYSTATGAPLWTSPGLGFDGADPGADQPAVANGLLYAGGTAGLYAFGLNG